MKILRNKFYGIIIYYLFFYSICLSQSIDIESILLPSGSYKNKTEDTLIVQKIFIEANQIHKDILYDSLLAISSKFQETSDSTIKEFQQSIVIKDKKINHLLHKTLPLKDQYIAKLDSINNAILDTLQSTNYKLIELEKDLSKINRKKKLRKIIDITGASIILVLAILLGISS